MIADEFEDDTVFEMPQWPNVKYNNAPPECELRIPDYLWFDSEELNHDIVMALRYLAETNNMLELGRNREFDYNYVRLTKSAALMMLLHYPSLKNWVEFLPGSTKINNI